MATFLWYIYVGDIMKRTFNVDNFVSKLQTNCKISEVKEFQADEVITTCKKKSILHFVRRRGSTHHL